MLLPLNRQPPLLDPRLLRQPRQLLVRIGFISRPARACCSWMRDAWIGKDAGWGGGGVAFVEWRVGVACWWAGVRWGWGSVGVGGVAFAFSGWVRGGAVDGVGRRRGGRFVMWVFIVGVRSRVGLVRGVCGVGPLQVSSGIGGVWVGPGLGVRGM